MKKTKKKKSRIIKAGGVEEYIAKWPKEIQAELKSLRATIRSLVPDAMETVSYFDMPGYSYEGYSYNGMFAWFSYKAPYIRLHVRPQALARNKKYVAQYATTKAVISFSTGEPIPKTLVKRLIMASLKDMKDVTD